MRSLNSRALTILARVLFPRLLKNVSDPLTGLFLVRRQAVDVEVIRPDGFKILLEILIRSPALHVSEIYFDFGERHSGDSKADVREGLRFLRQLLRLRLTVNRHLPRFLAAVLSGIGLNLILLWGLVDLARWPPLLGAALAAEFTIVWNFGWMEGWVFRGRSPKGRRRRMWGHLIQGQLFLFLVHLPLMFLLMSWQVTNYLAANLAALLLVDVLRYGLSEQWIWTRSSMVWQRETLYYDLHGILVVESQLPLAELAHFRCLEAPDHVDVQIRPDRQGTPSLLPGGISYDEQLGRFGFGLTVLPGELTQIVVSPLLAKSRSFLYFNVVEPVIRSVLIRKGFAFAKAAAAARAGQATLIHAEDDLGLAIAELSGRSGVEFMADDLVILNQTGRVYAYPKPVTLDRRLLREAGGKLKRSQLLVLLAQGLLYRRVLRRLGLWLDAHELPAATLNSYIQRLIPQPKQMLDQALEGITIAESAQLRVVILIGQRFPDGALPMVERAVQRLWLGETPLSFQPHPLLAQGLRAWRGEDLIAREREILAGALKDAEIAVHEKQDPEWWRDLGDAVKLRANEGYGAPEADEPAVRTVVELHSETGS